LIVGKELNRDFGVLKIDFMAPAIVAANNDMGHF
jgi:hypothetical protein